MSPGEAVSRSFSSFSELDDEPLLDLERAIDNLGGSEEAYREVVQVFLEGLPKGMRELRSSIATADFDSGLPQLHELASSLGVAGIWRAHRAARGLEMEWRRGALADAQAAVARLEELVSFSVELLRAQLERSSLDRWGPRGGDAIGSD